MILVRVLSFKVYITYKKVKLKVYIYIYMYSMLLLYSFSSSVSFFFSVLLVPLPPVSSRSALRETTFDSFHQPSYLSYASGPKHE